MLYHTKNCEVVLLVVTQRIYINVIIRKLTGHIQTFKQVQEGDLSLGRFMSHMN